MIDRGAEPNDVPIVLVRACALTEDPHRNRCDTGWDAAVVRRSRRVMEAREVARLIRASLKPVSAAERERRKIRRLVERAIEQRRVEGAAENAGARFELELLDVELERLTALLGLWRRLEAAGWDCVRDGRCGRCAARVRPASGDVLGVRCPAGHVFHLGCVDEEPAVGPRCGREQLPSSRLSRPHRSRMNGAGTEDRPAAYCPGCSSVRSCDRS